MLVNAGTAGFVLREELNTFRMGDGAVKPCRVIDNGMILLYVGIGWVDEREYKAGDEDLYPVVAEGRFTP